MGNEFSKLKENNSLILIPKIENYIEYILDILVKIPRTEKYSIGNEYKLSMYQMLEKVMYLNKIGKNQKEQSIEILNKIDVLLNCQRMYLRIMNKYHWLDNKKFRIAMEHIYEIGKIIGGLMKYYAKNNTK